LAVLTRSGEQRIWEYHNTLRTEDLEKPIVRGIAHDVTDRIRAEKALRLTNEKLTRTAREQELMLQGLTLFRTLLDQSNDAIEVIDFETTRFLDVNERASVELGYSREELLSMTVFEVYRDIDDATRVSVDRQLRESGFAIVERVNRRKDGSTYPVEVTLRRVRLDREYVIAISRNVTERQRTEDRLREFERVVENLEEMIVVVNREYRYVIANRAFLKRLGLAKEDVIGGPASEMMTPGLFDSLIKQKLDECFQGKIVTFELKYPYPELGERDLSITYLPVEGSAGIDRVAAVLRDVTDRNRAEEALRHSVARERVRANELETVLNAVPVPVFIAHDAECKRITGNRAAYDQIRVPSGANFSKSAPTGERPAFRLTQDGLELSPDLLPMQQTAATGEPVYGRAVTMVFEDGSERNTLVNAVPLLDEAGKPRGVVGASIDLTDLKRAEKALQESERLFRTVYERAPLGVTLVDSRTGRFLQANSKFCEIAGRTEEELVQLDVVDITHPDDIENGSENLRQLVEEKLANYEMEKRYLRPDGSTRWVRILVVPMWSKGEDRRWHMALVEDITERRRTEEALRESEERFRVALKNSPITVFSQDRDLRYTWIYNPQVSLSSGEIKGKTTSDVFESEDGKHSAHVRRRVLETGIGTRHEIQVPHNGGKQYFDVTIEPVFNSTGAVIGLTGAGMDVTDLREAGEALREAKKKLTEEKLYLEHEIDTELGFGEIIGRSKACRALWKMSAGSQPATPPYCRWAKPERVRNWWRALSTA
jgi:PAS domain S-box-containing protein